MSSTGVPQQAPGAKVHGSSPRRWLILFILVLICAVAVYNQIVVAALGPLVREQLHIGQTQLANMMMAPLLCSVFIGLLSGSLGDRFGPSRVVAASLVVAIGGAVLRYFAESFVVAFISMLLIGFGSVVLASNVAKLLSAWFRPEQMGMAVSLFTLGAAGATGIAQATGARFPSIQAAYLFCIAAWVVGLILFVTIVRDAPKGQGVPVSGAEAPPKPTGILGQILRNPHVWLAGIVMALYTAWQMTFATFLPTMLSVGKEMDLAKAGAYSSAFAFGALAGCIICPMIAAALKRMKPVIMVGGLVAGGFSYLAWAVAPSPISIACLAVAGIGGAAVSCLIATAPALLPSVGPARAGTAGGLIMATIAPIGGYVLPSLIIAPLSGDNYTMMAIMGAVTAALVLVAMIGIPEYGRRPEPSVAEDALA